MRSLIQLLSERNSNWNHLPPVSCFHDRTRNSDGTTTRHNLFFWNILWPRQEGPFSGFLNGIFLLSHYQRYFYLRWPTIIFLLCRTQQPFIYQCSHDKMSKGECCHWPIAKNFELHWTTDGIKNTFCNEKSFIFYFLSSRMCLVHIPDRVNSRIFLFFPPHRPNPILVKSHA